MVLTILLLVQLVTATMWFACVCFLAGARHVLGRLRRSCPYDCPDDCARLRRAPTTVPTTAPGVLRFVCAILRPVCLTLVGHIGQSFDHTDGETSSRQSRTSEIDPTTA